MNGRRKALKEGEHFPIEVYYDLQAWNVKKDEQASDDSGIGVGEVILIVIVVIVVFIGILVVIFDDYGGGSGFGGGHYYSSCAHSSCAHSSCACACACAGGGRAGCSQKDFYKGSVDVKTLNKVLKRI